MATTGTGIVEDEQKLREKIERATREKLSAAILWLEEAAAATRNADAAATHFTSSEYRRLDTARHVETRLADVLKFVGWAQDALNEAKSGVAATDEMRDRARRDTL